MSHRRPPLVSWTQLHTLEDSLGGETAQCRGFVSSYVDMWAGRFQRLSVAVQAENLDAAMDAALSLCTSSHMVGAERLEMQADDLVNFLRRGCLASASQALPALGRCGERTVTELMETYVKRK